MSTMPNVNIYVPNRDYRTIKALARKLQQQRISLSRWFVEMAEKALAELKRESQ